MMYRVRCRFSGNSFLTIICNRKETTNQSTKFLKGAVPDSQLQKSKMGAVDSIKKSSATIKIDPHRMTSHLFFIKRLAILAVRKVITPQLIPIKKGTPNTFIPRFSHIDTFRKANLY